MAINWKRRNALRRLHVKVVTTVQLSNHEDLMRDLTFSGIPPPDRKILADIARTVDTEKLAEKKMSGFTVEVDTDIPVDTVVLKSRLSKFVVGLI